MEKLDFGEFTLGISANPLLDRVILDPAIGEELTKLVDITANQTLFLRLSFFLSKII